MAEGVTQELFPSFALLLTLSLRLAFAVSWSVPSQDRQLLAKLHALFLPSGLSHVGVKHSDPSCLLDLQVSDPEVI